jgi:catechol 2,3-dioxygenase-like lactoylglutathione lyase family enzyme
MTIRETMFVIAVPNLATSAAFYRDVLGFEIHEVGGPGWRIYRKGACHILVGECPDAIPPRDLGDHAYFAYLVVDEVDAYHARVVASGAEIVKTLRDEPWKMREFGLRTADGHRIMLGQRLGGEI